MLKDVTIRTTSCGGNHMAANLLGTEWINTWLKAKILCPIRAMWNKDWSVAAKVLIHAPSDEHSAAVTAEARRFYNKNT